LRGQSPLKLLFLIRRGKEANMNWFQRHLNWTWVFTYLIWWYLNGTAIYEESATANVLSLVALIFLTIVSGWVIKRKGRSLWWILLTPIFSPLWLKNKSLVAQSLPTITDVERQECLAYYEEEKKLQLLSERMSYFFNKRLGKYEDEYFQARKARSEFWSSMEKIFEVNEYISEAATEIINRKKEMRPAPSAASAMSSAWESVYLGYKILKDPENIAAGSPEDVAVAKARQRELVKKLNESFRRAREEEREFCKHLKISSGEYQRIVDYAEIAVAADEWLRKLEVECP
jgi:hypothetical protein